MKNNKSIWALSLICIALTACGENTEYSTQSNTKVQTSLTTGYTSQSGRQKQVSSGNKPDFASIKDIKQRKQAFVNFMLPLIEASNQSILKDRNTLLVALPELEETQNPLTDSALLSICHRYAKSCGKIPAKDQVIYLLDRVNIVPASLVLAQSANESSWGTSRFAREGNNFFGQWCFTKGCGLVPKQRGKNQTHEVKVFVSPLASVKGYMHNINTSNVYAELRKIRSRLASQKQPISGIALAGGLAKYSQRGQAYIDEIRSMIRYNQFSNYDTD